jgi:predicted MFS family arabinose efflux permease
VSSATPLRQNRDFVLLQVGQGLSTLGSESTQIAFPLLVLALTHSPLKAGIVGFARFFPYVLVALPAGVAVDRWNRRRLMLASDALRALGIGSLVATLAAGVASFGQIVAVAFVDGVLFTLFNIAETGALRAVVAARQLPRAAATEQGRIATVQLTAGPLGGGLFGIAGLAPFLFDVVSYTFSLVSLLAIRTPFQVERPRAATRAREEIAEGFRWLREQRFLWVMQLIAAASNVVYEGLFLVLIVVARRQGLSSAEIGLVVAGLGAALLVGSVVAPIFQRRISMRAVTLLQVSSILLVAVFLVVPNVFVLLATAAPSVFLAPPVASSVIGYRLAIAPDALVGRINSVARTIAIAGAPAGSLLGGVLLDAFSARATVAVLLAWTALIALWGTLSPSLRDSPSLADLDALAA